MRVSEAFGKQDTAGASKKDDVRMNLFMIPCTCTLRNDGKERSAKNVQHRERAAMRHDLRAMTDRDTQPHRQRMNKDNVLMYTSMNMNVSIQRWLPLH